MNIVLVAILLVLTPIVCCSDAINNDPKGVSVVLKSSWTGHPLVAQATELVADQSIEKYWSLIDAIVSEGMPEKEVDQMAWLQKREEMTELDQEGLLSLSLATFSASPKCQLFQQHAENILNLFFNSSDASQAHTSKDSISWFAIVTNSPSPFNRPLFTINEVDNALQSIVESNNDAQKSTSTDSSHFASLDFPFDHRRQPTIPTSRKVIVFADYLAPEFAKVHQKAKSDWVGEKSFLPSSTPSAPTSSLETSVSQHVEYILRPFSPAAFLRVEHDESPVQGHLQDYGVELAFKNVEYRVLDQQSLKTGGMESVETESDISASQPLSMDGEPHENVKNVIVAQNPGLEEELEEIVRDWWKMVDIGDSERVEGSNVRPKYELSAEQLDSLSLKAMQTIYEAEEPFKVMRDISQNLPSVAHMLARVGLKEESVEQMNHILQNMDGAANTLVLNGRVVDLASVTTFSLQSLLSEEVSKYKQVESIGKYAAKAYGKGGNEGFSHSEIGDYLSASLSVDMVPKIDLMWDGVTAVVNDLETHGNYGKWPKKVRELLRPSWPGQLTPIAKNFFTIVFVLDPSAGSEGVRALDQFVRTVIQNQLPIRLAFLVVTPNPNAKESEWISSCSNIGYASQCNLNWLWSKLLLASHGHIPTFINFLSMASQNPTHLEHLKNAWDSSGSIQSFFEAISSNADLLSRQYLHLSSAGFLTSQENNNNNLMLFNGRLMEIDAENALGPIGQLLASSKQQFQQDIYYGKVDDETDLYQFALGEPSEVFPGYNAQIFASSSLNFFNLALTRFPFSSLNYIAAKDTATSIKKTSHFLIGDWSSHQTQQTLKEFISSLNSFNDLLRSTRLSILPLPSSQSQDAYHTLEYLIHKISIANSNEMTRQEIFSIISSLLDSNTPISPESLCQIDGSIHCEGINQWISEINHDSMAEKTKLVKSILASVSLNPSSSLDKTIIVTNGRVIVLNDKAAENWDQSAWMMLSRYEQTVRAQAAASILGRQLGERMETETAIGIWEHVVDFDESENGEKYLQAVSLATIRSDIVMKIVAYMSGFSKTTKAALTVPEYIGKMVKSKKCVENTPPMISGFLYIDPLSSRAQVVSSLLAVFMDLIPMELKVVLMPKTGLSEIPLKNYFRYVSSPTLRFDKVSGRIMEEGAHFDFLPKDKVMTLNLVVNSQWMVESTEAPFDLDNLLLGQVPSRRMKAKYELESILVEGSCGDLSAGGQPPRGLKLILGDASEPHLVDTVVMSNLGYFQLKANPGVWYLSLAEGRGNDIYAISTQSGLVTRSTILLSEFTSSKVPMKVIKKSGMEKMTLEEETEKKNENPSMWSIFGSDDKKKSEENAEDDMVHVFSVASGHLYERFLRIMMLSVKRNTQSRVKFWIIKNFLSPMFKQSVEALGREFGFEVELVQYSWPEWLRGQVEKQRKIWGYKILFLDVLFPLSLKKVIFIDADQVVRTDLKELMDLDLHGKPYGFTPFCEGESLKRSETSGFRFWDSGFWRDHLRGRPYHISALFVVDLERLRKFGFADQLRATYDQLSRDPGSLANLDQDLPNYLQHHVPIHSLPSEWLWCETWCSDESKSQAKTIDLCNNPLTKTPKLDNALRIIPEWTELDQTTSNWYRQFQHTLSTQSSTHNSQQNHNSPPEVPSSNFKDEL